MPGITFMEGQAPMKKLNLASLKKGIQGVKDKIGGIKDKIYSKLEGKEAGDLTDEERAKWEAKRKDIGSRLKTAGDHLQTHSASIEGVDMGPTGASVPGQSSEIPDIENIVPTSTPMTPITKKYKK